MNNLFRGQIKAGLPDDFAGVSGEIFQNWRTLESGERASCVWLSSRIDPLHRELSRSREFHYKVRQTEDLAAASKPYHWIPLLEHDNCRSGLLYLPPGGRIAMHDHPHTIGVSIVLDGTPLISQCDRLSECRSSITPVAKKRVSCTRLLPHQKSFIFPHKNNMHGFSSSGSSCLLLNSVFQKKAMHHHSFLSGQLVNRSLSGEHLSSALQKSLQGLFLSISLSLPASVHADDAALHADTAATTMAAMPFNTLERYALDGNVHAQARLAERYSSGVGVKKDLYMASIWYRRAAEGGCAEAQYQIGVMLLDGVGMTEDSTEGLEWIFMASQADHVRATRVFNYLMENPVALDC
jgi:hypothetical protein